MNEKDRQITSGIGLSNRAVQIFSLPCSASHSSNRGLFTQDFINFILTDLMFFLNLISELPQPNDFSDGHSILISARNADNRDAKRKIHSLQPPVFRAQNPAEQTIQRGYVYVRFRFGSQSKHS